MRDLAGRSAVVTGAASGIGKSLARRFAAEGMSVVLADVERRALDDAAAEIAGTVIPVVTDVSDAQSVDALAERRVRGAGRGARALQQRRRVPGRSDLGVQHRRLRVDARREPVGHPPRRAVVRARACSSRDRTPTSSTPCRWPVSRRRPTARPTKCRSSRPPPPPSAWRTTSPPRARRSRCRCCAPGASTPGSPAHAGTVPSGSPARRRRARPSWRRRWPAPPPPARIPTRSRRWCSKRSTRRRSSCRPLRATAPRSWIARHVLADRNLPPSVVFD